MSSVTVPHYDTIYDDTSSSLDTGLSNLPSISRGTDFTAHEDEDTEVDETIEEDREDAFYRDLRWRQEERQARLAARKSR
jgi:hypothetical protein